MSKQAPKIWFRTARQVHQYLTCPIGEGFLWGEGETAVKDKGIVYSVSEKTVYNHVDDTEGKEKLKRNRANAFARRTVDTYAKTHLAKVVSGADPAEEDSGEPQKPGVAAVRMEADAEVKQVTAQLKRLELKRELGQMTATAHFERELAQRFQGVKLIFSSFMRDNASEFLSFLGGDLQVAKEIIRLVDGDEEKAEELSGYVFSRKPLLLDAWKRSLTDGLNGFAMGTWFTEEMRLAWEALEASRQEESTKVADGLIKLVRGEPSALGSALAQYDIRIKEEM